MIARTPGRTGLPRWLPAGAWLAAVLLISASPAHSQPAEYRLDPEHVTAAFLVEHVGYARVLGLFRTTEGAYRFDEATGELSELRIVVATESVFTNHERRDEHLRSDEFLNTREFPEMVFTAAGARRTGERTFEIDGQLQLLGQTLPLSLSAVWNQSAEYPFGDGHYAMGVSARGRFKRSAYGMDYGVTNGWVGDEIEIVIELEARRQ